MYIPMDYYSKNHPFFHHYHHHHVLYLCSYAAKNILASEQKKNVKNSQLSYKIIFMCLFHHQ